MKRCRPWVATLALTLLCCIFGQAASWATTTPEPKLPKVAKEWDCSTVYVTPTPTETPPETPVPVESGQACRVTDWYTPDPPATVTATATETPSPVGTATVTEAGSEVTLAPAQFEKVDTFLGAGSFALGALLLIAVAAFVFYLSRPPTFGFGRRGRH